MPLFALTSALQESDRVLALEAEAAPVAERRGESAATVWRTILRGAT